MTIPAINCLFSHKFSDEAQTIGQRIRDLLRPFGIHLQMERFPTGVDCAIKMQTLDIEAVIFLSSPESSASLSCQLELAAAERQGIPVFTLLQSGNVSARQRKRSYWPLPPLHAPEFLSGVEELAGAVRARVSLVRKIRLLHPDNFFQETMEAAKSIAEEFDRALVAEYACDLAKRYRMLSDPNTQFWIVLALGKANTPQSGRLLDKLPPPDHPLVCEGIRQARAILRNEPPVA